MVTIGNLLAAHATQFAYSEEADRAEIFDLTYPELVGRLKAGETITGDCSSTYEATRKDAACIHLPPLGYTGSELETMPHITLAEADIGDAIVFGAYPGRHVVWITSPHPTNPSVNSGHLDPKIDSHGMPGFQETDLTSMWNSVFAGDPITVLSLAPFLPKPPPADPNHYAWYATSERPVVERYDKLRLDQATNQAELFKLEEQLITLVDRLHSVIQADGLGSATLHRKWRLEEMTARKDGGQVTPS
jgi:hypothetical protein